MDAKTLAARLMPALEKLIDGVLATPAGASLGTLRELSCAVFEQRNGFTAKMLAAMIEHRHRHALSKRTAHCPKCDRYLWRKRRSAKELSTMVGSFVLRRPYFYCPDCRHGFCPLDAALGLAAEHHQYDIQEEIARMAAETTYAEACEQFTRLTAIHTGSLLDPARGCSMRASISSRLGSTSSAQARAAIRVRVWWANSASMLVASADGAHAKIRAPQKGRRHKRGPGSWQEVKGFRLYLIGANQQTIPVASWHQRGGARSSAEALAVLAQRIPIEKVRMVLIADGAPWVWNMLRAAFPGATELLDRYHCKEYLLGVARAQFANEDDARCWINAILIHLHLGATEQALGEILDLIPANPALATKIENCLDYIGAHIDGFDYDRRNRQGFPIGSGAMESANRYILHDRLKKCGAWWLDDHCNEMLRVRCAIFNATFDRVFAVYMNNPPPRSPRRPAYVPQQACAPDQMAA